MKLIKTIGACIVAAAAVSGAVASASYADAPNSEGLGPLAASPFSNTDPTTPSIPVDQLRAEEIAVLTNQGISPAHAMRALHVQGKVAREDVVGKIEAATGSAYGGAWFEPAAAQVHIGVTSSGSRRAAEEVIAQDGLASEVTLTSVRSTWAQLEAAQKLWNQRLAALFRRKQVKTALSAEHNAVYITLSSSVPTPERAVLEHEASNADVNVFVTVVPSTELGGTTAGEKTECNKFETLKAYCNKPLTSGVSLKSEAKELCTTGPLAIPTANVNETYVLTAGHCGKEKESWFSFYKNGELNEIGKSKTFKWDLGGDFGEIEIENAAWQELGAEPLFAVTAEWKANNERSYQVIREGPNMEKTTVCHDGQTSGGSCGEIKKKQE